MLKKITIFLIVLLAFILTPVSYAAENSFVTVINPVRGSDFWEETQALQEAVIGQMEVLKKYNVPSTWLIRVDGLKDKALVETLKNAPKEDELGLFLEVTPTWTKDANVNYRKSGSWHFAESVLLTGYDLNERQRLVESAFDEFKNTFGYYPKSVGAWWVDSFSTKFMQEKYGIEAVLIVADQYSTDNYQIWGQYWQAPFYPAKTSMLNPAQSIDNKIPVVVTQWAARDPVGGFGKGVEESTLSVQPNDYIDYHNLDTSYFGKLVDIYTNQSLNPVNQLVVGLENSYSWKKYSSEYQKQIELLAKKRSAGQFSLVTQSAFAKWYKNKFKEVSPTQVLIADDPLGSEKKAVWFMNPYYRAGFLYTGDKTLFRDIRQYIDGAEELCLKTPCKEINFATFATRVLDEVTKGNRLIIDSGQITNFKVLKNKDYIISYTNQTGDIRKIELLPKDIGINGKISSIDATILQASSQTDQGVKTQIENYLKRTTSFKNIWVGSLEGFVKFLLFVVFALFIPGYVVIKFTFKEVGNFILRAFLSIVCGIVIFTLIFYFGSLFKCWWIILPYLIFTTISYFRRKLYKEITFDLPTKLAGGLILVGTIFQSLPVIKSGLVTSFGISFWGPNAHDGIWHLALVDQLVKGVIPQNPIFAGEYLKNYHYFYDLLVAATHKMTGVVTLDLIFRLYPVLFSLAFGVGTYYLSKKLFKSEIIALISVYLAYFSGSFGWIVEFLRERHIGGESAFWSNQPISFNLNPPFAISLIILICFVYLLNLYFEKATFAKATLLILILGSLVSFKAYGAVVAMGALGLFAMVRVLRKKDFSQMLILTGGIVMSILILLPNYGGSLFKGTGGIFNFAPFWFVHSMIDSPDRVGWTRLSLMRMVGYEQKNYLKIFTSETIGLLIFLVGNLGVRVLSAAYLVNIKTVFRQQILLYLFLVTLISLALPILFIQVGNPWNAIQFFYYGLFTTALFASVSIAWLFKKGKIGKILAIAFLVIAPINALVTANGYLSNTPVVVLNSGEKQALDFLGNQTKGVVLTYPYDPSLRNNIQAPIPLPIYETSAYVSAFANKQTYLEDQIQQEILQTDYKPRLVLQGYFFKDLDSSKKIDFLQQNHISYIYLPKIFNVSLPVDKLNLKVIFQNEAATVYEVIKQ